MSKPAHCYCYYTVLILVGAAVLVSHVRGDDGAEAGVEAATSLASPRQPKFGFLNGATSMISAMAQDLISRSTTSSQVLSLNLTNLVILFVLKAIIFGASSFGFGYGGHGRSADAVDPASFKHRRGFLSESELLLMLSYLRSDAVHDYDCLRLVACEDPSKVKEYLLAGKVFLKGAQLVGGHINTSKYSDILTDLQEAVSHGLNTRNCSDKYRCSLKNR